MLMCFMEAHLGLMTMQYWIGVRMWVECVRWVLGGVLLVVRSGLIVGAVVCCSSAQCCFDLSFLPGIKAEKMYVRSQGRFSRSFLHVLSLDHSQTRTMQNELRPCTSSLLFMFHIHSYL